MTLLSTLRNTAEQLTIEQVVDSSYIQVRQTDIGLDSALTTQLIPVSQDRDNKSYNYDGTLAVNTGDKRLYMARAGTFGTFDMYVKTAPVGAALNVQINKNAISIGTGTIADGANSGTGQALSSTSFSAGDYLTVDITQIGSSTAGEDLYINFRIAG
tara:strand:+ start:1469 stop:1939 length:471 start_codon:yes stop_codon:yes gene_type:complete